jgi:thiol:disulfide interchange protein DsbD
VGTLLMGLAFTLTSFTCTAPFVGTLLVLASQGDWQWPLVGMMAFAGVFALPFVLLALAPQLAASLPRSGAWLNSVKVSMGFLEVAAAMKFLSNADLVWGWHVFTRDVVLATWIAVAALLSAYLLGLFRVGHDKPVERVGAARLVLTMICLALGVHLATGLTGRRLGEIEAFLPPAQEDIAGEVAGGDDLPWILNDYEAALARARQENRLLMIDFTGYTCTNCRWMEANMFPRPDVRRELEQYVRVRLYTDGQGETYERHQQFQQKTFGTVALPYYAIVDAEGAPIARFPGLTRNTAEFVEFLQKARAAGG